MRKETLLEIVLGTIGGLIFALGMCMCLIPEWNMMVGGIIASIIGFIILLCIIPVYRKSHPKTKVNKQTDWGIIAAFIIGLIGALTMGFGMSKIMVDSASKTDMIIGLITGIIGLIVCVLNYPIYSYIKGNK
ncbi:MAG: hypothetical protein MRZ35_02620 [Firmicutes bacterium]|nr:hypothetical protein [Bacillota bacterium]